jgi:drug/metabolite transporter (DMT)-like permease
MRCHKLRAVRTFNMLANLLKRPSGKRMILYSLLVAAALGEVAGDLLFRKWGIEKKWSVFIAALVIYNIATLLWGFSLQYIQVSTGIIILGVLNVVLVVIGGLVFFGEKLSTTQIAGVVLGIASLALLGGED